jgi:hypothetical protein
MKAESFYLFQEHFGTFDVIQKLNAKAKRGKTIYATKTRKQITQQRK